MTLFNENNFEALKLLYKLYSPVKDEGLKPISDKFKQQLTLQGRTLVESTETVSNGKELPLRTIMANSQLVEKVIDMHNHFKSMIAQCFQNDSLFDRQLQISFQDFMNIDVGKFSMAELLAFYADKVLRKGGIKGEKKEIEERLDCLAIIFSYLNDKDLFLLVYRNLLARRLLQETYEDFELEKLLVTRLKVTCGMQQMN